MRVFVLFLTFFVGVTVLLIPYDGVAQDSFKEKGSMFIFGKRKKLSGKTWELAYTLRSGDRTEYDRGKVFIELAASGEYFYTMNGMQETGIWSVKKRKFETLRSDGKPDSARIHRLTSEMLVLELTDQDVMAIFFSKKNLPTKKP